MVLTTSITIINSVVSKELFKGEKGKITFNRSAQEIRRSSKKKIQIIIFTLNYVSVRSMHKKYIFLLGDRENRKK